MGGFSKLDSGITRSSIWSAPYHVRIVWISILAEKDETGFVRGSRITMPRICNVTQEEFDNAIKILSSPDENSQSKEFEGRRIDVVDGGWIVLNHERFKTHEQQKKKHRNEYMRDYMRKKRAVNSNSDLTPINTPLTSVSVSLSDSVSVSEYTEEFESFWKLYPRKIGKGAAFKSWKKIKSPVDTLKLIEKSLEWQKTSEQWTKDNGQYIPHPSTYLNQRRWEDEKTETISHNGKFVAKFQREAEESGKYDNIGHTIKV